MKRILIAGLGQMGKVYINALKKLGVEEAEILGHDIDSVKCNEFKQKFPGVNCFPLLHEDVHEEATSMAIVATNTPSHHKVIAELMSFGIRHLLCEKPIGINMEAVEQIGTAIKETGAKIFTAFLMNFSPSVLKVIEKMQSEDLIMTEGSVVWGKNRKGDKRPTPGDLEDESVHGVGILHRLAGVNQKIQELKVSAQLTYPEFVDPTAQAKAHSLDSSFPERVNATSMVLERIKTDVSETSCVLHSSFLYPHQIRRVSTVLSKQSDPLCPMYSVEMDFDVKTGIGGVEDQLTITTLDGNKVEFFQFACDKILDQTRAFLQAAKGTVDPRLADFDEAKRAVAFSDAVMKSNQLLGATVMV